MLFGKAKKQKEQPDTLLLKSNLKPAVETQQAAIPEGQEYEIVEKEILPEKMICPDCGGITLVGLDFCDKCGGELVNRDN